MQSSSFKKPKLAEQYVKQDLTKKMTDTKMTDSGTVVKPNNGGKRMGRLAKSAKKKSY